jgi:hypothetical protein
MQPRIAAAARIGDRIMEIICRQCEGNAFRILPEDIGTVAAECVICGTLTLIAVPRPAAGSHLAAGKTPVDRRCQPANGSARKSYRGLAVRVGLH